MDEYETELANGILGLNYRLLDTEAGLGNGHSVSVPVTFSESTKVGDYSDASDSDNVAELPRPIPSRARRRSSVSSSYEIGIHHSFVSALNQDHAKPKLSDFEPIKVLGIGSYGKVLLVRQKSTGRLFASKQLKKASLVINETNEIHEKNYQRTVNEKTVLEKVNHDNIVKLFYAFQDRDKVYLILEYLEGGELFHHLAEQKYMSEKDSSFYIAQAILALRYLHLELKVIFRDLKPENCMLNAEGNLVLTDFGLSKVAAGDDERKHSIIGTAQYMAPEVIKGEEYDFSVDWWSLGCLAFDMLTGSPPFTGSTNERIMDKVVHAKKYLKYPFYLSADAKDFLRKLLQSQPSKRMDVDGDFEKVKNHRFFRYINWRDIESKASETLPPILPVITQPVLAENFDEEFTSLPVSSFKESGLAQSPGEILHVQGFTFINESFLTSSFANK